MGKHQTYSPPARLHNAGHFSECLFQMGNIPYAKAYSSAVKCIVIKAYLLCVALHITDVFQKAAVNALIPAVSQHVHIYVVNNNPAISTNPFCHEHGDISSS